MTYHNNNHNNTYAFKLMMSCVVRDYSFMTYVRVQCTFQTSDSRPQWVLEGQVSFVPWQKQEGLAAGQSD